jgi:curved DNA-binding protein CbpA
MAALRPGDDPYRILGVLRGAGIDQIKAAHRRLAMRFHPDRATGDEQRFLAVQEAYQLLSDTRRRAEWDRRHAPGPSRAGDPVRPNGRRTDQEERGDAPTGSAERSRTARSARAARPPGSRSATWSAAHVPWWEEFRRGSGSGGSPPGPGVGTQPPQPASDAFDLEAHSRSSGAAWSAAARRHFRRADRDLPSRGAWRFRGTQVVTGAEARRLAEEEARAGARRAADAETGTQPAAPGGAAQRDGEPAP